MTPQQNEALEALIGRALTAEQATQIDPLLHPDNRNDAAIAAILSQGRAVSDPATKFTSLGIAERFPALNGLPGPLAAEMVLQKLEGFAAAAGQSADAATKLLGNATARQMGHLTGGGMAIGSPAIAQMLAVIVSAGAMSQAEADALTSVASKPDPIDINTLSRALNTAEGRVNG